MKQSVIIISASSDIGAAMATKWHREGWSVSGTYRTETPPVASMMCSGISLVPCDLANNASVQSASQQLRATVEAWDALILCPGQLDPFGPFLETDFNEWADSIRVNFVNQLRLVRELLPSRQREGAMPSVLFFAGGGTNSATMNVTAYTVSKIALIKMCELLDAEIPDTKFVIIGPGWVKTKIHEATLKAGARAGGSYEQTQRRLESGQFVSLEQVIRSCEWAMRAPREVVSGRNFSTAHDAWETSELEEQLRRDADMYKLRRHGNDWFPRKKAIQH